MYRKLNSLTKYCVLNKQQKFGGKYSCITQILAVTIVLAVFSFNSTCINKTDNKRKFMLCTFHGELKTNVNAAEADCNETVQSLYIRTAIAARTTALRTKEKQPKQTHMQQRVVANWTQKIPVNGDVNNL